MVDLRLLAFANLFKKLEKKINTEETKEEIRKGTATYKFADYAQINTKDYTQSKYSEEDQARIDQFIKDNHIEKVATTKENYAIEIVPSEKAIKEFKKMFDKLSDNQLNDLIDTINNVKMAINDFKQALKGGDLNTAIVHMEYEINILHIKLDKLNATQPKNIAKVASQVKNKI